MSVYDLANELAREVKNSPEYREYLKVKKDIEADPAAKRMLFDFMQLQIELQSRQVMGQKVEEAELQKLRSVAEIVQMNRTVCDYVEKEQRIAIILNDIQRILTGDLEVGFPELFENMPRG